MSTARCQHGKNTDLERCVICEKDWVHYMADLEEAAGGFQPAGRHVGREVHPGSPGTLVDTTLVAHWRQRALEAEAAIQTIHGATGRAGEDHGSTRANLSCILDGIASLKEVIEGETGDGY